MARLKAFGAFWYDFVIGDDWVLAAGVVLALVVTALVARVSSTGWWIVPAAIVILLPLSVWRGTGQRRRSSSRH
jgi:hypothetical protein